MLSLYKEQFCTIAIKNIKLFLSADAATERSMSSLRSVALDVWNGV